MPYAYKGVIQEEGRHPASTTCEKYYFDKNVGDFYILDNSDELELCGNGFHFSPTLHAVQYHIGNYDYIRYWVIEYVGNTFPAKCSVNDFTAKQCTSMFRFIRELSDEEVKKILEEEEAIRNAEKN